MDRNALFSLQYGVFVLGSHSGEKINACITNTCFQAASDPVRIAISVMNSNLTCEMIKQSGSFALSVLDSSCTFETIRNFGYQSGRNVNKFADFPYSLDESGNPCLTSGICAVLSGKVVETLDLGTHSLFIAEVTDAKMVSQNSPITYSGYQKVIKPKLVINTGKKIVGWRCKICGYVYEGAELPADFICPLCGHPASDFEPVYE